MFTKAIIHNTAHHKALCVCFIFAWSHFLPSQFLKLSVSLSLTLGVHQTFSLVQRLYFHKNAPSIQLVSRCAQSAFI